MERCKKCNKDGKQTGLLIQIHLLDGWFCEDCLTTGNQLTAEEARAFAVRMGYRISHRLYLKDEYLIWKGAWITEDGFKHPYPFKPPFHEGWNAIPNKPLAS